MYGAIVLTSGAIIPKRGAIPSTYGAITPHSLILASHLSRQSQPHPTQKAPVIYPGALALIHYPLIFQEQHSTNDKDNNHANQVTS